MSTSNRAPVGARYNDEAIIRAGLPATRDRVISAIYETVIRPELYDVFIAAWADHIQAACLEVHSEAAPPEGLGMDPELQAHFERAHDILEQLGRKIPQPDVLDQVRASRSFAMLAVSGGQVVGLSTSAVRSLDQTGEFGLDTFKSHLAAHSALVLDNLCDALRDGGADLPPVILTTDLVPGHLLARVVEVPGADGSVEPAIVIEALEYQWSKEAEAVLVTSFGLSRAELEIVRKLLAGHSLREIAVLTGRSEHTVRNQAKAVLAKTGAPGQVDLIRLVVFLINQDRRDRAAIGARTLPYDILKMKTGRDMQVFRIGPQTGRPVIFLHGMLDGMAPLRFLEAEFERRNWNVIAPVRPGFGRSCPASRADQALDAFSDHVSELIERMKLERPVLLGHLAGGPHAVVMAGRLKDQIAGAVAVSGGVPIVRAAQIAGMPQRQRAVAYTARFAPALLPVVLRAGIGQIDSADIDGFMTALYLPGTREHAAIERLGLASVIQSEYRFSVQQGAAGFASDCHFVVRDWSARIKGDLAPLICIHGGHDPIVPVQDMIAVMGNRPGVDLRLADDLGQLVLYERPDMVFAALEELVQ